jgi:hypothetical protein
VKKAASERTFPLAFGGGTLEVYVGLLRKEAPEANIVIDEGMGTVNLPGAPLKKVTVRDALEWVTETLDARKRGLILEPPRGSRATTPVFVFTTPLRATPAVQPDEVRDVKAYVLHSLAAVEPSTTPELVLTAVEDILQRRGAVRKGSAAVADVSHGRAAEVKASAAYNPATRMLTITGTRGDIAAAEDVIERITRGRQVAEALPRLQAEVDRLKTQVAEHLTKTGAHATPPR